MKRNKNQTGTDNIYRKTFRQVLSFLTDAIACIESINTEINTERSFKVTRREINTVHTQFCRLLVHTHLRWSTSFAEVHSLFQSLIYFMSTPGCCPREVARSIAYAQYCRVLCSDVTRPLKRRIVEETKVIFVFKLILLSVSYSLLTSQFNNSK